MMLAETGHPPHSACHLDTRETRPIEGEVLYLRPRSYWVEEPPWNKGLCSVWPLPLPQYHTHSLLLLRRMTASGIFCRARIRHSLTKLYTLLKITVCSQMLRISPKPERGGRGGSMNVYSHRMWSTKDVSITYPQTWVFIPSSLCL